MRFDPVFAALGLFALKPLIDAASERSHEIAVDYGTLWSSLSFAVAVYWFATRRTLSWSQVFVLLGVLGVLASAVVAAYVNDDFATVAVENARVVAGLIPAIILIGATGRERLRENKRWLAVLAVGVAVHAGFAMLQFVGSAPVTYFQAGEPRPSGLYYHPLSLGILLNFSLVFLILAHLRGWLSSRFVLVGVALFGFLIFVSTHRTSIVVLLIILLSWPLIGAAKTRWPPRISARFVAYSAIGVTLLLLAGGISAGALQNEITRIVGGVVGDLNAEDFDPTDENFLRGRGQRWGAALNQLASGSSRQRAFGHGAQVVDPHTDYLRVPLVHGVVGGVALLLGLLAVSVGFFHRADRTGRWVILLLIACTLLYAVTTKPTSYTFYMWGASALAWLAASSGTTRVEGGLQEGRRER